MLQAFPEGSQHGFIYRNGAFTSFNFLNAISTMNTGIDPRGDIVGLYVDREGRNRIPSAERNGRRK